MAESERRYETEKRLELETKYLHDVKFHGLVDQIAQLAASRTERDDLTPQQYAIKAAREACLLWEEFRGNA